MTSPHHDYPGGESAPAYRWAFGLWLVAFLGVLCVAFVNFLALYFRGLLGW